MTVGFCEELAGNTPELKSEYEKKAFVKVCKAVREVSEDNRTILSFKEQQDFNKRFPKALSYLIKSEIGGV